MKKTWVVVAIGSVLLAAPNALVTRLGVSDADPWYWAMVRGLALFFVCLPFMMIYRKRITSWTAAKHVMNAGAVMSVAAICFVLSIAYSQASYVMTIYLAAPIILVVLSSRMLGESLSVRSLIGMAIAVAGGCLLIGGRLLDGDSDLSSYGLATVLALVSATAFALAIIFMRKNNEHNVPVIMPIGVSAFCITLVSTCFFITTGDMDKAPFDVGFVLAVLYSGLGVALLARMLNVMAFRYIGANVIGGLEYLQSLLAVLLPVIIIGEELTVAMIVGGLVIMLGVYLIESKTKHTQRLHHHKNILTR